jgi:hypothetical protein
LALKAGLWVAFVGLGLTFPKPKKRRLNFQLTPNDCQRREKVQWRQEVKELQGGDFVF